MTNVVLKTDAIQSVHYDGMEISLNIKCEGLSMQASLRKLQESTDQLLAGFQSAAIDPASFSIEVLESTSLDADQKQKAVVRLATQGAADLKYLRTIWQVAAAMPFAIEMGMSYFLQKEDDYFQTLLKKAIEKAKIQADGINRLFEGSHLQCTGVKPESFKESSKDFSALHGCKPVEYPEGALPSLLDQLQIPTVTLRTNVETSWSFQPETA